MSRKMKAGWFSLLLITLIPFSGPAMAQSVAGTFDLYVEPQEWGGAVTKLVLNLNAAIDPATTVNPGDVTVSAIRRNPTNTNNDTNITFDGVRAVTGVTVSDDGTQITIDLAYGRMVRGDSARPTVNGSSALESTRVAILQYTVAGTIGGAPVSVTQGRTLVPILDEYPLVQNPVAGFNNQRYRVHTPAGANRPLPLVLWNHGAGETYSFNAASNTSSEGAQLLANMGGSGWLINAPEDAIVVAPQRGGGTAAPGYSRNGVIAYINYLIAQGVVDPDRVYISGCSAGGQETNAYMFEYPNMWAAAIPITPLGSLGNGAQLPINVAAIASGDFPIWIVTATNDFTVRISGVRQQFNDLKAAGVEVFITEWTGNWGTSVGPGTPYPNDRYDGHWSWVHVLNNELHEAHRSSGSGPNPTGISLNPVYSPDFTWANDLRFSVPVMDWLFAQNKDKNKIKPVLSVALSPSSPDGTNGWYKRPVSVSFDASVHAGSPLDAGTVPANYALTSDGVYPASGPLIVSDLAGHPSDPVSVPEIKIDQTAPVVQGMGLKRCTLWPANNKMVKVTLVTESDAQSGLASVSLSATSSEPDDPAEPDTAITQNGTGAGRYVWLRAERSEGGAGRIYTIDAKATDLAGNATSVRMTCTVPHDDPKPKN